MSEFFRGFLVGSSFTASVIALLFVLFGLL